MLIEKTMSMKVKKYFERVDKMYIYGKGQEISIEDEKLVWADFSDNFIEFINSCPADSRWMHDSHLEGIVEESLNHIHSKEEIVRIAEVWFNWLNSTEEFRDAGDYVFSAASYLMRGAGKDSGCRKDLFKRMIEVNSTGFITTNIGVFVDYWSYLSKEEQELILNLLLSKRNDIKWIQAVVLNRNNLCEEVQVKLLGKPMKDFKIKKLVKVLEAKNILEQCISIYCGNPSRLCCNGYHHHSSELWDKVIIEVLKRKEMDKTSLISLDELIEVLYNKREERVLNNDDIFIKLLKNNKKRLIVCIALLHATIVNNTSNKKMWDLLLKYSSEKDRKIYFGEVVIDIEAVEYNQVQYGDLFELFDEDVIFNEIYARLKRDRGVILQVKRSYNLIEWYKDELKAKKEEYKRCEEFIKGMDELEAGMQINIKHAEEETKGYVDGIKEMVVEFLIRMYEYKRIRLLMTDKIIKGYLDLMEIESEEVSKLMEEHKERFLDETAEVVRSYRDSYIIENWN